MKDKEMKQLFYKDLRIELLSERIIRIEMQSNGKFEDRDTFFIPNRNFCSEDIEYVTKETKKYFSITISDYQIRINKKEKGLNAVSLFRGRREVYHYHRIKNTGELPSLNKTPEVFPIMDLPRIVVPKHGYHYSDEVSESDDYEIDENASDLYLLLTDGDFRLLRKLYLDITGRPELLRLSTFGSWNSKYYPYTQKEAEEIIHDYQRYDVPLDNVVIDTDWRKMSNGIGYDINTDLFPDMGQYFKVAHENKIEIMFNDHPEPRKEAKNLLSPSEVNYREGNLQKMLSLGLDYWWYDRNWITKLISPDNYIHPETWGMYLFHDIEKHFFENHLNGKKYPRRAVVMSNVDNVANGVYCGIQNTASHRYPFQWTGDVLSNSLCENIINILRSGENCIPYVHPDCGGHVGNPNKELFIRWMQMGCFFPVLRPHCANNVLRTREPWKYDEETVDIVRDYIKLRYRLLPMIYSNAYQSYLDGTPLCQSLHYIDPTDSTAKSYPTEYTFCNLLVSYSESLMLMNTNRKVMSKSSYLSPVHATFYKGKELDGEPILEKEYDQLSFELNGNAIEENVPIYDFSARFEFDIELKTDSILTALCDDGIRIYVDGKLETEDWSSHAPTDCSTGILEKGRHHIMIEYFQDTGGAKLELFISKPGKIKKNEIYFPKGEWLDLFTGKTYRSKSKTIRNSLLDEMPLYVKRGSVLLLANDSNNTKDQKWDELTLDYYPSMNDKFASFLYEDDRETVGYQYGERRILNYSAQYDKKKNAFSIILEKAEGHFDGIYASSTKKMRMKYHILYQKEIKSVCVNGKEVSYSIHKRNLKAKVLSTSPEALDSDTLVLEFNHNMSERDCIEIYLE